MARNGDVRDGFVALILIAALVVVLTESIPVAAATLALGALCLGSWSLVRRQHRH